MTGEIIVFYLVFGAGAAVSGAVAWYSWRHREVAGADALAFGALANIFNVLFYVAERTANGLQVKIFWDSLQWFTLAAITGFTLLFALMYTGLLNRKNRSVLIGTLVYAGLLTLIELGNWWGLYFVTPPQVINTLPFSQLSYEYSTLFWVIAMPSILAPFIAAGLFARALFRSVPGQRNQFITIILGCLAMPALGLLGVLRLPFDISALGLILGFSIIAYAVFRQGALGVIPIAHDTLLDNMSDLVIVLGYNDSILDVNRAAETFFEIPRKQLLRQSNIVNNKLGLKNLKAEDIPDTIHIDNRIFELSFFPVQGRHGEVQGRLMLLHDVTLRRRAEHDREELIDDLRAYAHTVAHDLKNPINIILGYSELLQNPEGLDDSEMQIALKQLSVTSYKMVDIVNELLLLAHIREEDEVPQEPLDMAEIVDAALIREQNRIKEAAGMVECPETWGSALGHAAWVEEIWCNFISNAVKYGGSPPHIILGSDTTEDWVRFWVRDNGKGLTEEERSKIFAAFTRLDSKRVPGHGLGLSIVQRIVERLGGSCGVESTPGEGSTFYFTLPAI